MDKTKIAIKSSYISIIVTLIHSLLILWRTSVIIQEYGVDVNSITQASKQIFSYLVLLESGLGAAYLFNMYEPMSKNESHKVYSLYMGLNRKLKRIGLFMTLAVGLIAGIFPFLFGSNSVDIIQSGLIIFILGLHFVFPYYFIIAKKNLLIAEEKRFVVELIDGLINSLIIVGEIVLATVFNTSILITLSFGLLMFMISSIIYTTIIRKKYSFIDKAEIVPSFDGDELTNDILAHQVAFLANSNIDILILSIFNLSLVTVYSAYNAAMSFPITMINTLIENIRATIGLKLAKNDENIYPIFREILSLNYLITNTVVPVFIFMINEFIELWIGSTFTLSYYSVILFSLILIHKLNMYLIFVIRDGRGLYKESKKYTLVTAILNLILSLILVNILSINGLLLATVTTNFFIMDFGNYKLVYNQIFNKSIRVPLRDFGLIFINIFLTLTVIYLIDRLIITNFSLSWLIFTVKASLLTIISFVITFGFLFKFDDSFKRLLSRIFSYI